MGALLKPAYLPHYTYDDYARWEGDWELIEGVPFAMSPAPSIRHQSLSVSITWKLAPRYPDAERQGKVQAHRLQWSAAELPSGAGPCWAQYMTIQSIKQSTNTVLFLFFSQCFLLLG